MRSAWLNAKIQVNKKNIVILETKRHINTHIFLPTCEKHSVRNFPEKHISFFLSQTEK